jgi:hypothetical protein
MNVSCKAIAVATRASLQAAQRTYATSPRRGITFWLHRPRKPLQGSLRVRPGPVSKVEIGDRQPPSRSRVRSHRRDCCVGPNNPATNDPVAGHGGRERTRRRRLFDHLRRRANQANSIRIRRYRVLPVDNSTKTNTNMRHGLFSLG